VQLLRPALEQGPPLEPQPVGWFQFGLELEQPLAAWFRFDPELEQEQEQELPQAPRRYYLPPALICTRPGPSSEIVR
jgi:hypothetical protein